MTDAQALDLSTPEHALRSVLQFFEAIGPQDLPLIGRLYCHDAFFKDPFNEVRGVPTIERIFAHMFETLEAPRFVITQSVQQGAQCFVTWDFVFAPKSSPRQTMTIRGASHIVLREEAGQWRVAMHRDYWDAAEELYEKLPVLGSLMRWVKKKLAAG
jgi:ketosteroid isomerase-like protein